MERRTALYDFCMTRPSEEEEATVKRQSIFVAHSEQFTVIGVIQKLNIIVIIIIYFEMFNQFGCNLIALLSRILHADANECPSEKLTSNIPK